jgi:multiple antibiotic resistance protein
VEPQNISGQAFYPLTLPLTVGPGSISVAITLGANTAHRYGAHILLFIAAVIATALIALSIFLCYGFAGRLSRVLGKTGMTVMIRLSSFLLVCIGVQIMWNGLSTLLSAVHFQPVR